MTHDLIFPEEHRRNERARLLRRRPVMARREVCEFSDRGCVSCPLITFADAPPKTKWGENLGVAYCRQMEVWIER